MQATTMYTPAIRISTPNPWPTLDAYVADQMQRLAWCWHPARAYPALAWLEEERGKRVGWVPLKAGPKPTRTRTEQIPAIPLHQWEQEEEERQQPPAPAPRTVSERIRRGEGRMVTYTTRAGPLTYRVRRYQPYPWPKRLAHRVLNKLIAWRQGWRKVDRQVQSSGKSHPLNWSEQ